MMSNNDKILVGKIVAAQGIRGELRVQTFTQSPEDFRDFNVGVDFQSTRGSHEMRPLQFVRAVPGSSVIIMKAGGVDNRGDAEKLRNTELYVDRDALPDLDDDEFYINDLIGMVITNHQSPITNHVVAVHNFGAGDILELTNGEMVSFAGAKVDMDKREITLGQ